MPVVLFRSRWRYLGVGGVTGILVALEFAQLAIPSRGFGWADVGWTVLAGVVGLAVPFGLDRVRVSRGEGGR